MITVKKSAIVFSAGDYLDSISCPKPNSDLPGVKHDIAAFTKRLQQIGFNVMVREDALKADYESSIKEMTKNSPSDSISIVYFTGHGGHYKGENYVCPSDFGELYDQSGSVASASINIRDLISLFRGKGRLILILDACRDGFNQMRAYYSEMTTSEDVYIAYSSFFQESSGMLKDGLSWFTEAICDEILTPDIDVDALFTRVRQNVYFKHSLQIPSSVNALLDRVVLRSLPTYDDSDKAVFDFIEKFGDDYNEKHSYFQNEFLVFIDAAQFFGIGLLDAYWKYQKVQTALAKKRGTRMPSLSEEVQKIINFKIVKESGYFSCDDIHTWYYKGRQIRMGEIPPRPASLQVLLPEQGKDLNVDFSLEQWVTKEGKVICKGWTSLPHETRLIIMMHSAALNYRAQSKANVNTDGHFESSAFSDNGKPLAKGNYTIEITVPITSVQPEAIRQVFGSKGRNLTGRYVREDAIFGKLIEFTEGFAL